MTILPFLYIALRNITHQRTYILTYSRQKSKKTFYGLWICCITIPALSRRKGEYPSGHMSSFTSPTDLQGSPVKHRLNILPIT
jgi:hypothetical protein